MKKTLKYLALALAFLPACLHAQQATNVVSGRMSMQVSPSFVQMLSGAAVTLNDPNLTPLQSGTFAFPVLNGVVDLSSFAGELRMGSGLVIHADGQQIKLIDWVLDTTTGSPTLSALFVIDSIVQGRLVLFTVQLPSTLSLPLHPESGTILIQQASVSLAPEGVTAFNNLFGLDGDEQLQANMPVGQLDIYAVLANPSGGTK